MSENSTIYPENIQPFAEKLWASMNQALEGQNKREYNQLNKILDAVGNNEQVKALNFWTKSAKEFAREWEELRTQPTPEALPDQENSTPEPATPETTPETLPETPDEKSKRKYRTITIENGKNPFREGSKNYKIFELLLEGGHTREQIAEKSGADNKSVGYIIWLLRRSGHVITRDSENKTFALKLS